MTRIANEKLHHAVDFTPYEGMSVTGAPITTISRGEVIWRDGQFAGAPGRGRFLPCGTPEPAAKRAYAGALGDLAPPP